MARQALKMTFGKESIERAVAQFAAQLVDADDYSIVTSFDPKVGLVYALFTRKRVRKAKAPKVAAVPKGEAPKVAAA